MFGIDQRALRVAWTIFLFLLAAATLYVIRTTLVVFVLALFLAALLDPIVLWLVRMAPRRIGRTAALVIVYVGILAILIPASIPLAGTIGEEAASLAARLPEAVKTDPARLLPLPTWLDEFRPSLTELARTSLLGLDQQVVPLVTRAGSQVLAGLGSMLSVILIPILTFFFLRDGSRMKMALLAQVPGHERLLLNQILADLHGVLGQYVRALVVLSIITFVVTGLFLAIVDAPYAMLLAGVAAALEMIPVAGPAAAGLIILVLTGISGFAHVSWIFVFLLTYRIGQDYIVNPQLMSAGVQLHPLLVLFGVLAGEQAAGIPGMFFSVPVMAALRVIVKRVRAEHRHLPV